MPPKAQPNARTKTPEARPNPGTRTPEERPNARTRTPEAQPNAASNRMTRTPEAQSNAPPNPNAPPNARTTTPEARPNAPSTRTTRTPETQRNEPPNASTRSPEAPPNARTRTPEARPNAPPNITKRTPEAQRNAPTNASTRTPEAQPNTPPNARTRTPEAQTNARKKTPTTEGIQSRRDAGGNEPLQSPQPGKIRKPPIGRLKGTEIAPTPLEPIKTGVVPAGGVVNEVNQPMKPILKTKSTEEVPPALSGKLQKKEREHRTKSVTIAGEDDFGSVKPQWFHSKPATITGFREMSVTNFLVLLGFWFMRLFIPWIEAWHEFNFHLLREPSYWDPLERSTWAGKIIIFSARCVVTVWVSACADLINLRFYIYLALLLLFVLCPVTGAMFNDALVARSYDPEYYSKWAFVTDLMYHGAFGLAYIALPIQLSCIFSQEQDMSRQAHYNWIAAFVLLESVNRYVSFWVIPGKCPTRTYTQTAIWFAFGVAIFIVGLVLMNFTFRWLKADVILLSRFWIASTMYKENDNVNVKTKLSKSIWFSCILTCLVMTTFVFAALERLKPDESWDKHYVLSATSMFVFGEILGAAVMSSVSTVLRWKKPKYFKLIHPDNLALGLPHLINCLALLVLFGRFASLSRLERGDVIVGPVPDKNTMAVEFYNFDYLNRSVCVHSKFFRPLRIGPRERGTREVQDPGPTRVYFKVTADPFPSPGVSTIDSFEHQYGKWATFIITLPVWRMPDSGIKASIIEPEIIRVEGTQFLYPLKEPRIYFMNTFATSVSNKTEWTFYVKQEESSFSREVKLMLKWHTVVLEVPTGRIDIFYELPNSSNPQTVSLSIETRQYCVYSLLLGHARPKKPGETKFTRLLKPFLTMEVAGPDSNNLPSKAQLQRDVAVMTGMTLAGMASSGFFIGMVYLFWLDTPFDNYRTTSFAIFWVCLQIPEELAKTKAIDIGPIMISVLLFLQLICIVVNFVSGNYLYTSAFNFRKRPD